jgi:hypothetical protein
LGGIRLEEADVEERGFRFDRRWMLVDKEGMFVTQRVYPKLALLGVKLGEKHLIVFDKLDLSTRIEVLFELATGPEMLVTIWDDQVLAKVVHQDLNEWFSVFLGFEVRLVVLPESSQRKVDPRYAVKGESVSFADGMPYLIIGQESLYDLNSRLEQPVPMDRFRPNVVFSGGTPFQEDTLRKIKIGDLDFQIVKPCARCILTTVNQETGEKGKEPLKTLSSYRTLNGKVYFGQNMLALNFGKIRVGDLIQGLE